MVDERKIWAKVIGVVTFVLLEIAALSMLKHAGSLQDIWVSKASHRVMAWAWGGFDSIGHYFSLKTENENLAEENAMLAESLRRSQDRVRTAMENGLLTDTTIVFAGFDHIPASIVKISRNKQHNYFILNKGYEDGVQPQSGVVTTSGIVGIIDAVDKHYAYGLSFMNTGISISARPATKVRWARSHGTESPWTGPCSRRSPSSTSTPPATRCGPADTPRSSRLTSRWASQDRPRWSTEQ